jgi:hypothetical protein
MAPDDVVRRLIQDLRALKGSWWEKGASRLALALEWKLAQPPDREPWRMRLTGDDDHDRLVLALAGVDRERPDGDVTQTDAQDFRGRGVGAL